MTKKPTPGPWELTVEQHGAGSGSHGAFVGVSSKITFGDNELRIYQGQQKHRDCVAVVPSELGYPYKRFIYDDKTHEIDMTPHPDARLIAAAPVLLEACVEALDQLEALALHMDTNPWCKQLRAAIALAGNKTPSSTESET